MPARIMNGEALWGSARIAALPEEWLKDFYAWIHSLALDDGSFECGAKTVWHKCYCGNRTMSMAEVAYALDELERKKLLFRWLQVGKRALPYQVDLAGNHVGKAWGYWTNIEKPGRLPAPSDRHKKGPGVPQKLLEKFLGAVEKPAQMSLGARQAAPRKRPGRGQAVPGTPPGAGSSGLGLALDRDRKGFGLEVGNTEPGKDGEQAEVSPAPSSSSPLSSSPSSSLRSSSGSSSAGSSSSGAGEKASPAKKNTAETLEQKKAKALERVRKNLNLS